MIGKLNPESRKVTIVGAGVAGLLHAYFLDKKGYEVTLIEEQARAGGLIRTSKLEYGIAESAAHSLLADSVILDLFRELGVEWVSINKDSRARYIFRGGRIRKMPLSFFELLKTAWRALFGGKSGATGGTGGSGDSMTLEAWGHRYLGVAATQYLLNPFVRGIYGSDPKHISVSAAFPMLVIPSGKSLLGHFLFKKREKSERKQMIAPRFGMGDLVAKLEKRLEERLGNRFQKSRKVAGLQELGARQDGSRENLIVAVPAYRAGELIASDGAESAAAIAPLLQKLSQLNYARMVSVTAFVPREGVPAHVKGVGVLVPAVEKRDCLGILFNSSTFEGRVRDPERYCSFTLMFGGSSNPEWVDASDEKITQAVSRELAGILGINTAPVHLQIHRWTHAIPGYSPEIERLWEAARASWAGKTGNVLAGNFTGEVSLRGMIMDARALAQ